ncbi:hypothetical protein SAMN04489727_1899 [Amycolatopsis tolypomycina]|uniref:Uncharacterized protein n=1 Tax=Amycolatopsis tolypomycina TaxID=208445 RepID=A0A1H4JID3_9PSEU|nr:hypothetical protein [Amycolatopsis tolypomycina]SEB45636.1 hypothetical protein SAMN04489727_1899 [Amycolatopsis tolypomycina]
MTHSSHGAAPDLPARDSHDRTLAINRARAIIRDFIVGNAGFDAGESVTDQADNLAHRLADSGALIHTLPAHEVDRNHLAAAVIHGFIAESTGSDAAIEATDQAEELRHRLATAGLITGGVYEPITLHDGP